jgi:hypothetical protein
MRTLKKSVVGNMTLDETEKNDAGNQRVPMVPAKAEKK